MGFNSNTARPKLKWRKLAVKTLLFLVTKDDMCELTNDSDAKNTKKQLKYTVNQYFFSSNTTF